MDASLLKFRQTLQKNRISITGPRLAIFNHLQENGPITMGELAAACSPDIDRSSVYRSIRLFESLGIVQRLNVGWKYKVELSNDYQQHHHHLHCLKCGATIAIPEDDELETRLSMLAASQGFTAQDHQVEIRGFCQDCR